MAQMRGHTTEAPTARHSPCWQWRRPGGKPSANLGHLTKQQGRQRGVFVQRGGTGAPQGGLGSGGGAAAVVSLRRRRRRHLLPLSQPGDRPGAAHAIVALQEGRREDRKPGRGGSRGREGEG